MRRFEPQRQFDLLFVIDNSSSMAAKKDLLQQNLAKMMLALGKLEGGVPDVHIGVVSTDVGAGQGDAGGNCGAGLGDQGLLWGNDLTPGALATVAGSPGNGCRLNQGVRWIEDRLCPFGNRRYRNYQGELGDVLSCVGGALGNHGCGYPHALQALRLALNPIKGINEVPSSTPSPTVSDRVGTSCTTTPRTAAVLKPTTIRRSPCSSSATNPRPRAEGGRRPV